MKPSILLSALLLASCSGPPGRSSPPRPARNAQSQERPLAARVLDDRVASEWGLQPQEWARYRELMDGPLGIYSPNLDPLSALGIEARTDEERRRYAELQVQVEARRVEKLLAYQRAYDEAWQRLNPGMQRVNLPDDKPGAGTRGSGRMAVFVKDGCAACGQLVQRLQSSGAEFDLYMVGSRQDDARIRDWAKRAQIDPARVRAGSITLNHDGGRWLSLGLPGDLPAAVREVNGQWQRQPPPYRSARTGARRWPVCLPPCPGGSATGLPACRPARRHPLDGALRRGLAGERHPAQRAHRPVAVVPQRRRPVAPLRHARRRLRGLQQAMRATPHTRIDAGLGQINLGYHKHRFTSACDLLDPYRNLAIAAEILKEQHTPARTGCWRSAATTALRAASPPPAIGAACRATLPACRARDQPPRSSPRARRPPHDETPSRPSRVHGPAHAAGRPAAGLACRRAADRGRGPWRHVGAAVLRSPEPPAARQRTGAAVHPDAPGSRHTGGRSRDAAGAQRQAHARHRRAAGDRSAGLRPFVVIGDDEASRAWLQRRAAALRERGAVGLVVNVETAQGLARLRALAPGVPLAPVAGDDLADRLGLRHYPALITATGIEQ
jgi:integrating conjugative element protein (TIGR03759 family)